MIQNADGVYALATDADSKTVDAGEISINGTALDNFNNCKVWLESTDAGRITTAKIALNGPPPTPEPTNTMRPTTPIDNIPKTGDPFKPIAWLILSLISTVSILMVLFVGKKEHHSSQGR